MNGMSLYPSVRILLEELEEDGWIEVWMDNTMWYDLPNLFREATQFMGRSPESLLCTGTQVHDGYDGRPGHLNGDPYSTHLYVCPLWLISTSSLFFSSLVLVTCGSTARFTGYANSL